MKNQARYSVYFGLQGCYMPDSHFGVFEVSTRKELASLVRNALAFYEMPACLFRGADIAKRWGFIKRNGASCAHFSLAHGVNALTFSGLTEEEFERASAED